MNYILKQRKRKNCFFLLMVWFFLGHGPQKWEQRHCNRNHMNLFNFLLLLEFAVFIVRKATEYCAVILHDIYILNN